MHGNLLPPIYNIYTPIVLKQSVTNTHLCNETPNWTLINVVMADKFNVQVKNLVYYTCENNSRREKAIFKLLFLTDI